VFTSAPVLAGRVYEITITGTYSYKAFFQIWSADAFYDQDWRKNFSQRHDGVYLDGKALRAWVHREDPRFVAFLRQHSPSLVVRLTAEVEALLEVERLEAATPPPLPAPPPPPRRKPTVHEFRARLVKRFMVKNEDRKAVLQAVLVGKAELIQEIDGFELTEEERGQLLELIDALIAPHLDELVERKEGTRGLAKILD
jgi:hypothetical protein